MSIITKKNGVTNTELGPVRGLADFHALYDNLQRAQNGIAALTILDKSTEMLKNMITILSPECASERS